MPSQANSPAVQSMRNEQARQRKAARKGEPDEGLEGTFPASDPVSLVHTTVSARRADRKEADLRSRWEYIEAAVRSRPLTAIGIAAALAYVLGAKR